MLSICIRFKDIHEGVYSAVPTNFPNEDCNASLLNTIKIEDTSAHSEESYNTTPVASTSTGRTETSMGIINLLGNAGNHVREATMDEDESNMVCLYTFYLPSSKHYS